MSSTLAREYCSVGVNRGPQCVAFVDDARAVFCGGDGAHGYDVDAATVVDTSRGGRGGRACCVATTTRGDAFVGDAEGEVRATATTATREGDARVDAVGRHERGPVRDCVEVRDGVGTSTSETTIVVTCADDGGVVAWERRASSETLRARGRVTLASAAMPLCVDVVRAPSDGEGRERHVLAVGCVDGRVRVYVCDFSRVGDDDENEVAFEACGTLDGHTDWVRGVKFAPTRSDDCVFLASASQDKSARVWRIQTVPLSAAANASVKDVAPFMRLAAPPKPPSALLVGYRIKTSLESLLIGHEDWVMSVAWHPDPSKMVLMTASMDRSLMLWSPTGVPSTKEEAGSELWMSSASLGEAAAVCLGYYGASFSPGGDVVLANSHGGALHVWRRSSEGPWLPMTGNSGHTMRATGLQWDTAGRYLMSGSQDQTTRVHAPWRGDGPGGWRQVARPQVHGHDIVCFAMMRGGDGDIGTTTYVSGADEKVLRVFDAPGTFLGTLANSLGDSDPESAAALVKAKSFSMESLGAELPALGLSNKALRGTDGEELPSDVAGLRAQAEQQGLMEEYNSRGVEAIVPQALASPPLEEVLAQATLWPETRKLYGHGNEIRAVAAHPSGDLIASASSALTSSSAAVWIWSRSQNWKPLGSLSGATLTINALEFSPDTAERDYLLAASRDRHVCVFAPSSSDAPRGEFGSDGWHLLTRFKAHDREIYAACWAPCGTLFATAGRDKKIKLWRVAGDECAPAGELPKFGVAPTATAFARNPTAPPTLAVGFDDGSIEVHVASNLDASSWTLAARASDHHGAAVRAVAWRPGAASALASCADDNAVHVYAFSR